MELTAYIKIIKKNILVIILLPVVGSLLAFYLSTKIQKGYGFAQTFYVAPEQSTLQPQLTPDQSSYFTQEKVRNFTDTAVSILESPDFARDLAASGAISIHKAAPQLIQITASSTDPQNAKTLMEKTVNTFNLKLKSLSLDFQIKAIGTPAAPQKAVIASKIVVAFGAFAGLAVAILALSLKMYFRL